MRRTFLTIPPAQQPQSGALHGLMWSPSHGVQTLLTKNQVNNLYENTYIIYTSDNGSVPIIRPRRKYPKSYNYPLQRGKWDAMEGGIRVPLIVCGPKVKKGTYNKKMCMEKIEQ